MLTTISSSVAVVQYTFLYLVLASIPVMSSLIVSSAPASSALATRRTHASLIASYIPVLGPRSFSFLHANTGNEDPSFDFDQNKGTTAFDHTSSSAIATPQSTLPSMYLSIVGVFSLLFGTLLYANRKFFAYILKRLKYRNRNVKFTLPLHTDSQARDKQFGNFSPHWPTIPHSSLKSSSPYRAILGGLTYLTRLARRDNGDGRYGGRWQLLPRYGRPDGDAGNLDTYDAPLTGQGGPPCGLKLAGTSKEDNLGVELIDLGLPSRSESHSSSLEATHTVGRRPSTDRYRQRDLMDSEHRRNSSEEVFTSPSGSLVSERDITAYPIPAFPIRISEPMQPKRAVDPVIAPTCAPVTGSLGMLNTGSSSWQSLSTISTRQSFSNVTYLQRSSALSLEVSPINPSGPFDEQMNPDAVLELMQIEVKDGRFDGGCEIVEVPSPFGGMKQPFKSSTPTLDSALPQDGAVGRNPFLTEEDEEDNDLFASNGVFETALGRFEEEPRDSEVTEALDSSNPFSGPPLTIARPLSRIVERPVPLHALPSRSKTSANLTFLPTPGLERDRAYLFASGSEETTPYLPTTDATDHLGGPGNRMEIHREASVPPTTVGTPLALNLLNTSGDEKAAVASTNPVINSKSNTSQPSPLSPLPTPPDSPVPVSLILQPSPECFETKQISTLPSEKWFAVAKSACPLEGDLLMESSGEAGSPLRTQHTPLSLESSPASEVVEFLPEDKLSVEAQGPDTPQTSQEIYGANDVVMGHSRYIQSSLTTVPVPPDSTLPEVISSSLGMSSDTDSQNLTPRDRSGVTSASTSPRVDSSSLPESSLPESPAKSNATTESSSPEQALEFRDLTLVTDRVPNPNPTMSDAEPVSAEHEDPLISPILDDPQSVTPDHEDTYEDPPLPTFDSVPSGSTSSHPGAEPGLLKRKLSVALQLPQNTFRPDAIWVFNLLMVMFGWFTIFMAGKTRKTLTEQPTAPVGNQQASNDEQTEPEETDPRPQATSAEVD